MTSIIKRKQEEPKKRQRPAYLDDQERVKIKKAKKTMPKLKVLKKGKQGIHKKNGEGEVWKWWEEKNGEVTTTTAKWKFLEHKGPAFAPPYEPLPDHVKFYYDNKEMRLSQNAEEVACLYAKMLNQDCRLKTSFNTNFFKDWRNTMSDKEKIEITDLNKCNFKSMHAFFTNQAGVNRNRKRELKNQNKALAEKYGFCTVDGHKEKICNFKIEPPALFRGRGEHPKIGMLKRRVEAEDVIINCSENSVVPEPPPGHCWKEVRHDTKVMWLASWTENVQNKIKYVLLNPSSKLRGERDCQKYETARRLHKSIDAIREKYRYDWKSNMMWIRQRAVALYLIDKLALRAGNERDGDHKADTVGCCSLRVEHIKLHREKNGKQFVVILDFLGKGCIRYYNEVSVEPDVFKNLQLFTENKASGDHLFDRLNTYLLNRHLDQLMEGLTAKVFRTYNASWTLQQQLDKLTRNAGNSVAEKILSYNRANRAVAVLCNHLCSVPVWHEKSMKKLREDIDAKKSAIRRVVQQVRNSAEGEPVMLQRLRGELAKLEILRIDRDESKTIILGTAKLNYMDPRISVAWCKKYGVPVERIYNKTQRDRFRWAIDTTDPDYVF